MSASLRKIVRRLTADRRKLSMLLALGAVVLLLWGRLLLKQVPRTAVADPENQALSVVAPSTDWSSLLAKDKRPTVFVELPAGVTRDLFHPNRRLYRPIGEDAGDGDGRAKSDDRSADDTLRIEQARRAALDLRLQSTLLGDRPSAWINNQLIRIGEKVDGFTLKKVTARSVVVEIDGVLIRLEM